MDGQEQERAETIEPSSTRDDAPLLRKLEERAEAAAKYWQPYFRRMRAARRYALGQFHSDEGETRRTRVNVAYSTVRALMPHIYAQDPDIAITPDDGVEDIEKSAYKGMANCLSTAVSRSLRHAELKTIADACTLAALTSGLSYAKVTYQRDYTKDPSVTRRLEDARDELARLEHLIAQVEDEERHTEHEADRERLQQLLKSLEEEPDVIVAQGIAIDRVMAEHMLPDPAVQQWENFTRASEMFQIIYKPKDEAEAWLGIKLEHAKTYSVDVLVNDPEVERDGEAGARGRGRGEPDEPLVKIIECWRLAEHTVYTWVEGEKAWAREPYVPRRVGKRWYPFFALAFFPVEGRWWPKSLVDELKPLQDEYNDVRNNQAEIRSASVPGFLAAEGTEEEDIRSYTLQGKYEVIVVKGQQGLPLDEVFKERKPPTYNPALYDVSPIRVDIDQVSGVSDVARGAVQKTKTLGEAQLLQQNLQNGASKHRDVMESWIEEMARYVAEMLLLELNPVEAARLAGPAALQHWPVLEKRDIWGQMQLDVAAGTTGRPDLPLQREAWGQMLPLVQGMQQGIRLLQMQGQDAAPEIALLKRIIKLMDPTADADQYVPQPPMMPLGGIGLGMGMPMGDAMAGAAPDQGPLPANVTPISAAGGV